MNRLVLSRFLIMLSMVLLSAARLTAAEGPFFETRVHGLLKTYCWKCHGGEAREAGLDLRSLPLLLEGGKNGPSVVAGAPEKSLLIQKLVSGKMPPGKSLKPTAAHIETIRNWVAGGARGRYVARGFNEAEKPPLDEKAGGWWSFRPPVQSPLPAVKAEQRVQSPVDRFVLARLEAAGLNLAPPASPATLVRRAYLDLVGLPPSPWEVDRFLADTRPGAWSRLIDSLLADPRYGERWGRHWLDTVGYVDTIGSDNDAKTIKPAPGIWRYRDYVIRAFNSDKPFDDFLVEQLAGDELVDWRRAESFSEQDLDRLVATGFLRQSRDVTYAPELNTADIRHQVLFDTLQTISAGLLGLTIHCAQCHSHKFDPISQVDYYRMAAIFTPAYDVQNWLNSEQRQLQSVPPREKDRIDGHNKQVNARVDALKKKIAAIRTGVSTRLRAAKLARLPGPIRADTDQALKTAKDKRTPVQGYLAAKLGPLLAVSPKEIVAGLGQDEKKRVDADDAAIAALNATRRSYEPVRALWEQGPVPKTYLYRRGDFATPGPQVSPGVPLVLDRRKQPTRFPPVATAAGKPSRSTGYRRVFARWLTGPDHPLTARVIVNRLWQRYFGTGLVASSDNFGLSGSEPTHPRLLDWLARELIDGGWSLKRVHRFVLLSSIYQQSTSREPLDWDRAGAVDPTNRLYWRMPLRRLESEVIRDSVLAVSGQLDLFQGGPAVPITARADSSVVVDSTKLARPTDDRRRSLYLTCRRNYHPTELSVFDQPTVTHNCSRRDRSAVVLQSLVMLNGAFVMKQSRLFAARVRAESSKATRADRVDHVFRLALCRVPTAEERRLSLKLLVQQANSKSPQRPLEHLCHMLLNANEFLYTP